MKRRFEAKTLEEVYLNISKELKCSINDLDYTIIQYPTKGFFGLFAKNGIIEVNYNESKKEETQKKKDESVKLSSENEQDKEFDVDKKDIIKKPKKSATQECKSAQDDAIVDSFFNKNIKEDDTIYEPIDATALENKIKKLLSCSCFSIDTVEVDIENDIAYVFLDGDDAALLIGKEGYRYNALSYLLFNWFNIKYGLYLKLEISQFLASQQDMIKNQMQSVIEHVEREGWGKTRELNGILIQIALEYLRETFPNKYVAIKQSRSGKKYIAVNEFKTSNELPHNSRNSHS